eukprot:scaffold229258_cov33-Tisochrysis_lutea.AAC.2
MFAPRSMSPCKGLGGGLSGGKKSHPGISGAQRHGNLRKRARGARVRTRRAREALDDPQVTPQQLAHTRVPWQHVHFSQMAHLLG